MDTNGLIRAFYFNILKCNSVFELNIKLDKYSIGSAENVTLVARWTPSICTVTFNTNGGTEFKTPISFFNSKTLFLI